jgi:hypothetical protein
MSSNARTSVRSKFQKHFNRRAFMRSSLVRSIRPESGDASACAGGDLTDKRSVSDGLCRKQSAIPPGHDKWIKKIVCLLSWKNPLSLVFLPSLWSFYVCECGLEVVITMGVLRECE